VDTKKSFGACIFPEVSQTLTWLLLNSHMQFMRGSSDCESIHSAQLGLQKPLLHWHFNIKDFLLTLEGAKIWSSKSWSHDV
jgi:hypothetical protein